MSRETDLLRAQLLIEAADLLDDANYEKLDESTKKPNTNERMAGYKANDPELKERDRMGRAYQEAKGDHDHFSPNKRAAVEIARKVPAISKIRHAKNKNADRSYNVYFEGRDAGSDAIGRKYREACVRALERGDREAANRFLDRDENRRSGLNNYGNLEDAFRE